MAVLSRLLSQQLGGWLIDYIGLLLTVNLLNVAGRLSLLAFKTLFLSLGFNTLTMMYLRVDLYKFILLGELLSFESFPNYFCEPCLSCVCSLKFLFPCVSILRYLAPMKGKGNRACLFEFSSWKAASVHGG